MRIPRIPRLTLFSGPNCSLCDIAKAELSKVRQSRPFELDTINIQDKGQEKWKKKYVYWIPALHLEGKEIAKVGRDGGSDAAATDGRETPELILPFFACPIPNELPPEYEPYGIYQRADERVLGEVQDTAPYVLRSRCFNCGNEEHTLKECPFRLDYNLIDLSRQYYRFTQEARGVVPANWERLHIAEGWRQIRLGWIEDFQPGKITGGLLKQALGNDEAPWLRNMARWGYPKGWVGHRDPQELVRERIWKEYGGDAEEDLEDAEPFLIFDEDGRAEQVDFATTFEIRPVALHDPEILPLTSTNQSTVGANEPGEQSFTRRWANYPSTYFLSDLLPVHGEIDLPPMEPYPEPPPPPPSDPPPPLPPPPPPFPPPALPPPFSDNQTQGTHNSHLPHPIPTSSSYEEPGSDMELSDED